MVVSAKSVEIEVDAELAEKVLDNLSEEEMAEVFNDEYVLADDGEYGSSWNSKMVNKLNEYGRKHIKKMYDLVCAWYETHPEDAEAEGYTEW